MNTRRRIGVYGGTFDPPHLGHLIIASEIHSSLQLDEVLFVPAGVPPHKDPVDVSAAVDRLAMLRLAVAGTPAFRVDTVEIDRKGRSFTADTLATIHRRESAADLWFIMGADSLNDLHTWRTPERIVALARLAVAVRPGWAIDLDTTAGQIPEAIGRIDVIPTPLIDIASHDLRDRVHEGRPIRFLVPDPVAEYIRKQGTYRSRRHDPD